MPPPSTDLGADGGFRAEDATWLRRALAVSARARLHTSPNPWVGAVLVSPDGEVFEGWTAPPGGFHAERRVIAGALGAARGATVYTTLEPCSHHGRTPPCTDALIEAGVARVVVGLVDPDPSVAGAGIAALESAGTEVAVADTATAAGIEASLAPYLHHRRTGLPYVVLKLAATLDGRTAAPDGTSEWITGPEARADVHRLRAESDAIVVGAGTVRADDPALTVRDFVPADIPERPDLDPRRIVLGSIPAEARVTPAESHSGSPVELVDRLGREGVIQVLVEGGADVAGQFHRAGLVDRYVVYVAPAILGGGDGRPILDGEGVSSMADVWRGRTTDLRRLGNDIRIQVDRR